MVNCFRKLSFGKKEEEEKQPIFLGTTKNKFLRAGFTQKGIPYKNDEYLQTLHVLVSKNMKTKMKKTITMPNHSV